MLWVDKIVKQVGDRSHHVDDMTTPSGYSHIGSLVGPIYHDVVYKAFRQQNKDTVNTYVFNDFDVIDGLPEDLKKTHGKYMGYSGKMVPAPYGQSGTFADYFANDFKKVLESIGVEATFISSWDMYHQGKFNDVIKIALDNATKIQDVYHRVSGSTKKAQGWYPFQVICPKCNKIGTTKVTDWDGEMVTYTCEKDLVKWAEGCGHTGTVSPFDGNGKLPWKVDWPAHWKVMGVTFEGAGKDHGSAGGSYDTAFALCDDVYKYPKPYHFVYEWLTIGGKSMSSSKGVGFKAREATKLIPAEMVRFLFVRKNPKKSADFDPMGNTIPDLFDEFDRCAKLYWEKPEDDLARAFYFSKINNWYDKPVYLPRFRDIATVLQLHSKNPMDHFEGEKGSEFTDIEKNIFDQRVGYVKYWLGHLAPENMQFRILKSIPEEVSRLSKEQKEYLGQAAGLVEKHTDPEKLQTQLYEVSKKLGLGGREAFQAIYISLIGKAHGPKAAWLISSQDPKFIKQRFEDVSNV